MNPIFIDSHRSYPVALMQNREVDDISIFCNEDVSDEDFPLYALAVKAKEAVVADFATTIFINLEGAYAGTRRSDCQGLDIGLFLRCSFKLSNPIIFFGFQSAEQLLRRLPHCQFIFASGCSYVQLPIDFSLLAQQVFQPLKDWNSLIPFLKAAVDMHTARHQLANVWGVTRVAQFLRGPVTPTLSLALEIYRYIHSNSATAPIGSPAVNELSQWFHTNQPSILYYDDQADTWAPVLQKLFGPGFQSLKAEAANEQEILTKASSKMVKCILLDLRLRDEVGPHRDPMKLSGGRLLGRLKKQMLTLPVVMITATNKAESVRALLKAGAEYVWTKEGVDDGIDDAYSEQNLLNLLREVKMACEKFENVGHRKAYGEELRIAQINASLPKDLQKAVDKYKAIVNRLWPRGNWSIVFDTNFLIDAVQDNYCLYHFNMLMMAAKQVLRKNKPEPRIRFVLHEDVSDEVSKKSLGIVPQGQIPNPAITAVTSMLVRIIQSWKTDELVYWTNEMGRTEASLKAAAVTFPTMPPSGAQHQGLLSMIQGEYAVYHELVSSIQILEQHLSKMDISIKSLPEMELLRLHADAALIRYLPKQLKYCNVVFLSSDNALNAKIEVALNQLPVINQGYNSGLRYSYAAQFPTTGADGNQYYNNYHHYKNEDFAKEIIVK